MYTDDFKYGKSENVLKRPGKGEGLFDDTGVVLFKNINPTDVNQGELGDCWLLSSMATLAEWPDAIRGLFNPREIAPNDKYTLKLFSCASQSWTEVVIDSRIPVDPDNDPCYLTKSDCNEIWPMLIEKAMASLLGGYNNLGEGGNPSYALAVLTGCTDAVKYTGPGIRNDDDETWRVSQPRLIADTPQNNPDDETGTIKESDLLTELDDFHQKNYPMCCVRVPPMKQILLNAFCSCLAPMFEEDLVDEQGIAYGHAYSLIAVMKNVAGSGYDLVCLRNPWGSRHPEKIQAEWNGEWSDGHQLWKEHPEVRAATGHLDKDDGLFWMPYEDFVRIFSSISVCKKNMGEPSFGKKRLSSRRVRGN